MSDMFEELEAEREERNADLKERAVEKSSLVQREEFTVVGYTCGVRSTSVYTSGTLGRNHNTGQRYFSTIIVDRVEGIESVVFPGQVPLRKGDRFAAWFLKGEEVALEGKRLAPRNNNPETVWVPRDYGVKERAHRIALLDGENVVANYVDGDFKI
tara:strand:+ start:26 stop:493 length:468 start_codon:yes stop_codon:yes gene_type:complete